jgi:hypothetical protein
MWFAVKPSSSVAENPHLDPAKVAARLNERVRVLTGFRFTELQQKCESLIAVAMSPKFLFFSPQCLLWDAVGAIHPLPRISATSYLSSKKTARRTLYLADSLH